MIAIWKYVKVGFSQKVMAKFSNLSDCHSCEPKIVPALLIPVNSSKQNTGNFLNWSNKKSPHYEISLKDMQILWLCLIAYNAFQAIKLLITAKVHIRISFNKLFWLMQKNHQIDIFSLKLMPITEDKSPGSK